jgi:hypothetical protein
MDNNMTEENVTNIGKTNGWLFLGTEKIGNYIHDYWLTLSGNILKFSFDASSKEIFSVHHEPGWEKKEQ